MRHPLAKPLWLTALLSVFVILVVFITALVRLDYPFELEWIEGAMANHTLRIMEGEPLYVKHGGGFTPYLYTPMFYLLSAGVSFFNGIGIPSLRIVSLMCSLGTMLILSLYVLRETKNIFAAILTAGIYASLYKAVGFWFDIARVDATYLFFLSLAVYLYHFANSRLSYSIAALVFILAFFSKQSALVIIGPVMIFHLLFEKNCRWFFPVVFTLMFALVVAFMELITDRWFSYYILFMPSGHIIHESRITGYWTRDLWGNIPVLLMLVWGYLYYLGTKPSNARLFKIAMPALTLLLIAVFLILDAKTEITLIMTSSVMALLVAGFSAWFFFSGLSLPDAEKNKLKEAAFYLLLLSGLVGTSYMTRLHSGGFINNLMPVFFGMVLVSGVALGRLLDSVQVFQSKQFQVAAGALLVLLVWQMTLQVYYPPAQWPTEADEQAGWSIVKDVNQVDGEVFCGNMGFICHMAGKKNWGHGMALSDITRSSYKDERLEGVSYNALLLKNELGVSAVIIDTGLFRPKRRSPDKIPGLRFKKYFLADDAAVLWPVTGMQTRPDMLYIVE